MLVSICAQIFGLLCLSLALDKHYKSVFKKILPHKLRGCLKFAGWLLIGLSLLLVVLFALTPSIAIVYWLAILSGNILLLVLVYCRL
jgi:putative flippase GtrA